MALLSLTLLPSHTACLSLRRLCSPPSATLAHCQLWHQLPSSRVLSRKSCRPRVSRSGSDPQSSDGEDPPQQNQEVPADEDSPAAEPKTVNNASVDFSATSLGSDSSSSSAHPVNNVAALQVDRERQQTELGEKLDTLSRSLELLSSALVEISSAVRVLSSTLDSRKSQTAPSSSAGAAAHLSPSGLRDARQGSSGPVDPPEPWDNAKGIGQIGVADDEGSRRSEEDTIPLYLVEQNERAHKLAYRLQQSFIQARIEGLGKPFQVAAEDFVQACIEAHGLGIGLKELQLQLVLQDGSLTGAFAIRNQRWSDDPILNEESRIRSLWVRLVYSTLAQLEPTDNEEEDMDPIDSFVKQVLQMESEQGYDLGRLKLEQAFAGPDIASGAVKALRENRYLILLTLGKAKFQGK